MVIDIPREEWGGEGALYMYIRIPKARSINSVKVHS